MQRVLSFTYDKKKYISKPFDFQAAVLIQESQLTEDKKSIMAVCSDAIDYLFEGTEATQDILDSAVSAKIRMCGEVWEFFKADITGKNDETPSAKQKTAAED